MVTTGSTAGSGGGGWDWTGLEKGWAPGPAAAAPRPLDPELQRRTQDGGVWTCTGDVPLVGGVAAAAARGSRGPEWSRSGPGSGDQLWALPRARWRRQPGRPTAASAASVIAAAAAAAASAAAAATAAVAFRGGRAPGPAGRSGARWDWRRLEAGGGRVLPGGRDPCVPQTHLEQQPGGARVPAGREGARERDFFRLQSFVVELQAEPDY